MKNPFVYGKEVAKENFCNRTDEINELTRDIENSQNVLIFSQRRFGKTSLIKRIYEELDSKRIITLYVDLYPVLTEEDFVKIYARSVSNIITKGLVRKIKDLAGVFKQIRPTVSTDPTGQSTFSVDFKKEETLPVIEDVLDSLYRYINKEGKQAVVCFDEFQQITQLKTDRLEKQMRSKFQSHEQISYIFMGSKKHLIYEAFNNPNRPFYRSVKPFPLKKIQNEELEIFIKDKFRKNGKKIPDNVINNILTVCESHPYYIQYICHIVWENTIDKNEVTEKEFSESLQNLLERESSAFTATWDLLSVKQKQVLIALAEENRREQIFSTDFLKKYDLGSASSVQRTVKSLLKKDLVDKTDEVYSIIDVIFKKWIITHRA
ncbi:MAG: AAA family ATPase [Elusimicrobiota bacterium]